MRGLYLRKRSNSSSNNDLHDDMNTIPLPVLPGNIRESYILNLENDNYNLESFYNYWQNNNQTIENEIKNQFNVKHYKPICNFKFILFLP